MIGNKKIKIQFKSKKFARRRRTTRRSGPQLNVGIRVPCIFPHDNLHRVCEILDIKTIEEKEQFYVHFVNYDKRLDIWVTEDFFDKTQIGTKKTDNQLNQAEGEEHKTPERKVTRAMKRKLDDMSPQNEFRDPELAKLEKKHKEATKVKNIETIFFLKWEIPAWYYSPYPKDKIKSGTKIAYICDKCLAYLAHKWAYEKHQRKCRYRHPPGDQIYQHENYSFWEVDGGTQKFFCQNLCLLAKLFLDHKTLYYDVDAFMFYVFTETDQDGTHLVGYFSKEKMSGLGYNLACIMVLPPFQRKGWGKFLIHFSYQLSRLEGKKGTPEIPLSDLGRVSYHSYWRYVCLKKLEKRPNLQLSELSNLTSIKESDIITALQDLNLVKYWKRENVINPNQKIIKEHLEGRRPIREIFPNKIMWIPRIEVVESEKKKRRR